ncbi:MAG: FeoB-associated Cys-rich membrane protein [Clostridia bacterium]|nr:FeoB-associated Cys-rich membrane protein [Clostridia bacterium]
MLGFLFKNAGTILVGALLFAAIIFALIKIYKDRKKGHTCGGNCMGCAFSDTCKKKDR